MKAADIWFQLYCAAINGLLVGDPLDSLAAIDPNRAALSMQIAAAARLMADAALQQIPGHMLMELEAPVPVSFTKPDLRHRDSPLPPQDPESSPI